MASVVAAMMQLCELCGKADDPLVRDCRRGRSLESPETSG
jgi:hypothetical protein